MIEIATRALPAPLAERVAEALAALYSHPERALLPWYRYTIYAELIANERAGGAARAWLDILATRRVLFCWQPYARSVWPGEWTQPEYLLALAERLLRGAADRAAAAAQLDRAHALADVAGEPATSPHYCAWCVFEAGLRALESAWAVDQWRVDRAATGATGCADDAGTYAAIAVAGGSWRPSSSGRIGRWDWQTDDAQLRRAVFWEWWLRDAVAAAWDKSEDSGGAPG
jgi:hypothetical protein